MLMTNYLIIFVRFGGHVHGGGPAGWGRLAVPHQSRDAVR